MKDIKKKGNLIMNLSKFIFNLKIKKKTTTNFVTKLFPCDFTVYSKNFIKGFFTFYFKKESLFFFYPIFVSKVKLLEKLFAFTKFSMKKQNKLRDQKTKLSQNSKKIAIATAYLQREQEAGRASQPSSSE